MKQVLFLFAATAALAGDLPPPANRPVDFARDIQPLFEAACVKCHAKGKDKGGFSLETRARLLKGGDTGPGAEVGQSAKSLMVKLITSDDPDEVMPKKGKHWTPAEVGLLRAWIDQGAKWPDGITFARPPAQNLDRRTVEVPPGEGSPVDRLLAAYQGAHGLQPPPPVGDAVFARRVYLDGIGLLPTAAQLEDFEKDGDPGKRTKLVRALLADRRGYADHWLTFWNDLLRNDYKGTGYIDGGRKQISGWLYHALYTNEPYDRFVQELVDPVTESEGFTKGIVWRGSVNASMTPPMQAAQNIAQVFMGVNMKCASCHDSFVNDWALSDCYGLAAVYADGPLELTRCDKPTGKKAEVRFLYPQVGNIDAALDKPGRIARMAALLTSTKNGRLSRTLVNRLWARLMGRGLVEPLDDMEQPAWNRDLLDWLAEDLVAHQWDVKRTLEMILTSRAYAQPSVESPGDPKEAFVFRGPLARRLDAEQFCDAVASLIDDWPRLPLSLDFEFQPAADAKYEHPRWMWTDEPLDDGARRATVQAANAQLAAAMAKLQSAQRSDVISRDDVAAARKTLDEAMAEAAAARDLLSDAPNVHAVGKPGARMARPDSDRHSVVFRRRFTLAEAPGEAHVALAATQPFDLRVNGREAKARLTNRYAHDLARLYDVRGLLVKGENVIAISVDSHTGRNLSAEERQQHPESLNHLNTHPGVAFYLRAAQPGAAPVEVISDAHWHTQREPGGDWGAKKLGDEKWPATSLLAADAIPMDEGPSLPPTVGRAEEPVNVAAAFGPALALAVRPGEIRASLLPADALQVALERPNREVVVPVRATAATTLEALELTNGATLDAKLRAASARLAGEAAKDPAAWLDGLYRHALGRKPVDAERTAALELLGTRPTAESVADVLWAVVNLPEFQLIQ